MITLSPVPRHYPECCLSISEALFTCIARCLKEVTGCLNAITESSVPETTILSVGCGTGFLEALLNAYLQERGFCATKVTGVEVPSADVRYLPSDLVAHVSGTRSVSQRAGNADILLFVYPRDGDLIRQYLTRFSSNIRMMLWLGPQADWIVQRQALCSIQHFHEPCLLEDAGLATYEVAYAFRNRTDFLTEQNAHNEASEERLSLDIDLI